MTAVAILIASATLAPSPPSASKSAVVSFQRDVAPLFVAHCVACHNPTTKKGKYDLASHSAALAVGKNGAAILPGKPEQSPLLKMVAGKVEPAMPMDAPALPPESIRILKDWIAAGATFDGADPKADIRQTTLRISPKSAQTAPAPVTAIAFHPKRTEIAVSGAGEVTFWSVPDLRFLRKLATRGERAYAIEYSPDGKRLLVAGGAPGRLGDVVLWELASAKPAFDLMQTTDVMLAACFSPDGRRIAASGTDRFIHVWDAATGKEIEKFENHADWVQSLCFTPDGKRILSASRDKTAKVWDEALHEVSLTIPQHNEAVTAVVALDDKTACSIGMDKRLRFWNIDGEGRQRREEAAHEGGIAALKATSDGRRILTAGADGKIKVWKRRGGLERTLEGHRDWVYSLAVSSDGGLAASGSWDGELRLWDLESGKEVRRAVAVPAVASAKR